MTRQVESANLPKLREELGPGESEVIALGADEPDCLVVLDDLRARQLAKQLGLRITGTLGVLLKAKEMSALDRIEPLIDELERMGFRLSEETREAVLVLAGE